MVAQDRGAVKPVGHILAYSPGANGNRPGTRMLWMCHPTPVLGRAAAVRWSETANGMRQRFKKRIGCIIFLIIIFNPRVFTAQK